jgi:hypothetical protein
MKYSVLLAALLAVSLSACGKKEEAAPAPAPEVAAPAPLPPLRPTLLLPPLRPTLLLRLRSGRRCCSGSRSRQVIGESGMEKPAFGPVFFRPRFSRPPQFLTRARRRPLPGSRRYCPSTSRNSIKAIH